MKRYDEEYLTDSPEEQREKEQREEIKRIVRGEIRRVERGEADEDIADDIRREEEQKGQERKRRRPRWLHGIRLVLTGEILIGDEMSRFYNYATYIALMFFLSIVVLFAALSIRIKEQRYRQCSHSAIVERLEQRGIELYDPLSPSNVIK